MQNLSHIAKHILKFAETLVKPGITTDHLDRQIHNAIVASGCYPSPLHYGRKDNLFPKSICTSINNIVCHGIPDSTVLQEGDIINIDITLFKDNFHMDLSGTFVVEKTDASAQLLIDTTRECLERAIHQVKPGVPFSMIGSVIESYASRKGFTVVDYVSGHGIGESFHEPPVIIHTVNNVPGIMQPGTVFTIEPILCEGSSDHILWKDGWTVATKDGGWTAQFEHTVCVTNDGAHVFTK